MSKGTFSLELKYRGGYQFVTNFGLDGVPEILLDEPDPIGDGEGPPASRMLAVATAQCLASSLIFCLQKARVELEDLKVDVTAEMERNEARRLRIPSIQVRLAPVVAPEHADRLKRCEQLFEDFCIVTQSVRNGVDISVELETAAPLPE